MSILLDALKKSKAEGSETSPFIKSQSTISTPTRSSAPKLSSTRISVLCALVAIVLYMGIISLWGNSPSQNPQGSTATLTTLELPTLEGIVWDSNSPIAILQGQPVKIGDLVGDWKVESILTDRVHVSSRGITKTLALPQAQIQH